MRYYILRHGSNAANQSMTQTMRVAEVKADSEDEALSLAHRRVTCYNNQQLEAIDADMVDAEEAGIDERVTLINE